MDGNSSNTTLKPGIAARTCPAIIIAFSGYNPPCNVVKMVRGMLDSVPEKYLVGLSEVVLTNAAALTRSRRRSVTRSRGRKVRQNEARGLYHPAFQKREAWIEIFVDNTLRPWESGWWKYMGTHGMALAEVLFHEIGHHIHATVRPEYRETEDVADVWKVRLERNYRRYRHRWFRLLARYLGLRAVLEKSARWANRRMFARGYISRAEYEEFQGPFGKRTRT